MKKQFAVAAVISLLTACNGDHSHTVSGRLNFGSNTTVVLSRITDAGEVPLDSTTTDGSGRFELRNAADVADYYLLRTGPQSVVYLILDGSEDIVIDGDARHLEDSYSVKGSEESELIRQLRSTDRRLTDSLNRTYAELRNSDPVRRDSVAHELEMYYTRSMQEFAAMMIRNHPGSLAALSATKFLNQSTDLELLKLLCDSLSARYSGNPYVEDYKKLVADLQLLPAGSEAPPIRLNTPDGKPLSLSDYRGKVLLVDFWASWCGPCRRANPDLKRLYEKYRSHQFEILGVSLDENAEAWRQAILADGLPWKQISELKKWDSRCVKDYHLEAIPYSVLLDRKGKILAKGLTPEELDPAIRKALDEKQ